MITLKKFVTRTKARRYVSCRTNCKVVDMKKIDKYFDGYHRWRVVSK